MDLTLSIDDAATRQSLYGPADRHLRIIRNTLDIRISARDSSIKLSGRNEAVSQAAAAIETLCAQIAAGETITDDHVVESIAASSNSSASTSGRTIDVYAPNVVVVPKTEGQADYVDSIRRNDLTFCLGPAGTGKTYLAVALAVSLLKAKAIKRVVLVRPAVEAGEKLGYLPGDMQAKVNPYLRPLFDAMHDMMSFEQIKRFMENDIIEVIPLAFMRGRTLNNSVVILDEAQNATPSQMLMFLTRLGHDTKMVVTGDASQTDLPEGQPNGMLDAVGRLRGIKGIGIIQLKSLDIVRHKLVQHIVKAYGSGED